MEYAFSRTKAGVTKSVGDYEMKTVFEWIRDLREDHDLTQRAIAYILGVTQQQYSQYETGTVELPLRHFIKLAEYYNVSADYLMGRKPYDAVKPLEIVYATRDCTCEQLVSDILSLDEESRRDVVKYVELQKLKQSSNTKKR